MAERLLGTYNATPPSLTDGHIAEAQLDAKGNLKVTVVGQDQSSGTLDGQTAGVTGSAVTTTQTGADQTNAGFRGVIVVLDMTVVGTGSVTLSIQGKDTVSGKYYTLLAGAAVTTNSTNVYTVYPGVPATANVSANSPLPRTWRVLVTANNANATTYTVGASLCP
jgi:hypothetical protein